MIGENKIINVINLTFSAQICPKINLGLEVEKVNVGIRTSILDIFFTPNLPKNRFRVGNSENNFSKNNHPQDTMIANFQAKQTTLTFLAQICTKMDLGSEIQKTNAGIRIIIFEIQCMSIFGKNRQL